eukprot:14257409-Alexandrium_andersonii.AAC.2
MPVKQQPLGEAPSLPSGGLLVHWPDHPEEVALHSGSAQMLPRPSARAARNAQHRRPSLPSRGPWPLPWRALPVSEHAPVSSSRTTRRPADHARSLLPASAPGMLRSAPGSSPASDRVSESCLPAL